MLGMTMVWLILVYIILSVNYRLRRKIIRAEWWNVKEFFYKGKPVRLKFEEIDHTPKTFNMSYNHILRSKP
jgi:hypothetical protein